MATQGKLEISPEEIAAFCRKHHIRRMSFFGSVLREDFNSASDVDVLVEFEPGHVPGLRFFTVERELGQLLGRRAELHTPQFLSPDIRSRVLAEAEVRYVAP
jgi:predicted nucleotidyltransferase